ILKELKAKGISVKFDDDDQSRPGWKFAEYELKGVPVRVAIGNRDIENGTVEVARRDTLTKETQPIAGISDYIADLLDTIQVSIYEKAKAFRADNTFELNTWEEFTEQIEKGGFISAHWDGTDETEDKIKELTKATIRCIPIDAKEEAGSCILTGKPSTKRVIFAKAY
ncbi:MAG: His/Gly/Thr/Pro-type tRNA ligase C-terminal domain-containing protein, partial [Spirosomaceae bacterium]|nr:His/Gly/Thr/Pro-type tRNA ligase C-terminal domain-containing protein [Spirosomataceae bacterium]